MSKKKIYVVQYGTGSNLDLLPLAAGLLVSRLKLETEFLKKYDIGEIIFGRPDDPAALVESLGDIFAIGINCSLWNMNLGMATAYEVRKRFPNALIMTGGPSIAKDPKLVGPFFEKNPYIDAIVTGEGEEAFVSMLKCHDEGKPFDHIAGVIYRDRQTGAVRYGKGEEILNMPDLPSPFLDGTFDELYGKQRERFSGIIWETNRGCPFTCTFCTWGNYESRKIRYNSMDRIAKEIDWIGRNQVSYIAMTDANFGIHERDVQIARMLAECKKKYGVPRFISLSWVKNSSNKVLTIGDILREAEISFRVTLTLQSTNAEVLKAVNRINMKRSVYEEVRRAYHEKRLYSYTELIMGLPLETLESYLGGIDQCLSNSTFDQIYIYPLFLFPNTEMSSPESIEKYKLEGRVTTGGYTKSIDSFRIGECVEIVISTSTMSREDWVEAFVMGFFTVGIHDDRVAFFVFRYLSKEFGISIMEFCKFFRTMAYENNLEATRTMFEKLKHQALTVQRDGSTHLIEPDPYGGICYDPPQATSLELLYRRDKFYPELFATVEAYLKSNNMAYNKEELKDLFVFQEAVIAHADGPKWKRLTLKYDWLDYFRFTFNLEEEDKNKRVKRASNTYKVVDDAPCYGDATKFVKNHFDIRGEPAFNEMYDEAGMKVFPPVDLKHDKGGLTSAQSGDSDALKDDEVVHQKNAEATEVVHLGEKVEIVL